jgi:hypothetical protein
MLSYARKRVGSAPAKAGEENIIDADPSAEALATFKRPLRGRNWPPA